MTAIRVEVTAEDIAASEPIEAMGMWQEPVRRALARLTGQLVDVDGGDSEGGCIATIGQGEWTIVVDLPTAANDFLDRRWERSEPGEPFGFEIEVPTWIQQLVRSAA